MGQRCQLVTPNSSFIFEEILPSDSLVRVNEIGIIIAPMHGTIVDLTVKSGDKVHAGDQLLVLEAMKMQHELVATIDGYIGKIVSRIGHQVSANDFLLEIKA